MENKNMRKLNVTVQCMAVYNSSIMVPRELTFEEAIKYAKEHIDEINLGELEYISDSDELDEENCDFDEEEDTDSDCRVLYETGIMDDEYEDYWFKVVGDTKDELTKKYMEMCMVSVTEVVYSNKEQALGVKRLFPFNYDVIMPDDTELKDMLESLVNEVNGRHEETET